MPRWLSALWDHSGKEQGPSPIVRRAVSSNQEPKSEREIYEVGEYCELLMRNDIFNQLCAEFEDDTIRHMLQTSPHEAEKREQIYASMRGQQDFLGLLATYVEAAKQIKQKWDEENDLPLHADEDDFPSHDD